jgi:hypothetical protein
LHDTYDDGNLSIGYGVSFRHSAKAIVATLCFFRLWLGLDIGGDYLLSATIMLEYSNKKTQVSVSLLMSLPGKVLKCWEVVFINHNVSCIQGQV